MVHCAAFTQTGEKSGRNDGLVYGTLATNTPMGWKGCEGQERPKWNIGNR